VLNYKGLIIMQIVVAGIIKVNGRLLIARRKAGDEMGGRWEFPGETLCPEESPEQGLKRELEEELGVTAEVGRFLLKDYFQNGAEPIELLFYEAF